MDLWNGLRRWNGSPPVDLLLDEDLQLLPRGYLQLVKESGPVHMKTKDIRSFFASPSAAGQPASKRRRIDHGAEEGKRNEVSKEDAPQPRSPSKVHPFFDIKYAKRPAQASKSAAMLPASASTGAKLSIELDAPLPTPDSMFTTTDGQSISKFNKSLDLVYWPNFIASPADAAALYSYLLHNLAWHRVKYYKERFKQSFSTPRWTTTFGRDDGEDPDSTYDVKLFPIPPVLHKVQQQIEARTGERYNAIIVNFYADGNDSISYHSDDEGFLGPNPAIASLTLGTPRPFLLRRKANAPPIPPTSTEESRGEPSTRPSILQPVHPSSARSITRPTYRLPLPSGSLLLMRGKTQSEWEHSIPKSTARGGAGVAAAAGYGGGRMNLTFRRVRKRSGTLNFIQYNRGDSPQYRWVGGKMVEAAGGL